MMTIVRRISLLVLCGCSRNNPVNVLILLLDDVGTDIVAVYGRHPDPAATPNIDALASSGLLLLNAYAQPMCSPTRAALLTGRYSDRFGLGTYLRTGERWELPPSVTSLPRVLDQASRPRWDHSAVGKWHLTTAVMTGPERPLRMGWNYHAGSIFNVDASVLPNGGDIGWHRWEKSVNGDLSFRTIYPTTDTVNDALMRMEEMRSPWLLYVAFNAAHSPPHDPPTDLQSRSLDAESTNRERYLAAVEAMDTEIGRLLADVPDNTMVMLLGDNGTSRFGIGPPTDPEQRKGTVNEGGVRVPFIISAPWVEPGASDALVHVTDILPTIAELADVTPEGPSGRPLQLDGQSLLPLLTDPSLPGRADVYSSVFEDNGRGPYTRHEVALRDRRYTLIRREGGQSLHDLNGRVDDGPNLLEQPLTEGAAAAYDALNSRLDAIVESFETSAQ